MRTFATYLNEQLLLETNYEDMFKQVTTKQPDIDGSLIDLNYRRMKNEITWAKKVLKKQDRITWYLKIVRFSLAFYLYRDIDALSKLYPKDKNFLFSIPNKYYTDDSGQSIAELRSELEHFLSLELHDINKYQFTNQPPDELITDFKIIERKWKADTKRLISKDDLEPGDDVFIRTDSKHSWWLLDRRTCSIEGEAMGHCGNAGGKDGDRILSLREKIEKGPHIFYKPHLTFIFNETGMLGEMKAFGNEKPTNDMHGHIIKLLQDKRVRGIVGGGYAPDNNFQWDDLTDSQKKQVTSKNPDFIGSLREITLNHVRRNGQLFEEMIHSIYENSSYVLETLIDSKLLSDGTVLLSKYSDPFDIIRIVDSDKAKYLREWDSNPLDYDDHRSSLDIGKEFLPNMPLALDTKFRKKYGLSDDDNLIEAVYGDEPIDDADEIISNIYMAREVGWQAGTYENYKKYVFEIIEEMCETNGVTVVNERGEKTESLWETCYTSVSFDDFVNIYANIMEEGDYFYDGDFFNPIPNYLDRNGFDYDYDEKAAYEAFEEYL